MCLEIPTMSICVSLKAFRYLAYDGWIVIEAVEDNVAYFPMFHT